jgi:uncharacterized protein involved in exopolysaccharide biosynthesis
MSQDQKPQTASQTPPYFEDDSIDLVALVKSIWSERRFVVKVTIGFAFLGLLVGFLTPKTYTATSTFVPQTADAKSSGSLGGLAALAGINLNAGTGSADIPAALYPKVLASVPFKQEILATNIIVESDTVTFKEYLLNQSPGVLSSLKKYTIGLPGLLLSALKEDNTLKGQAADKNYIELSDEDYALFKSLEGVISIETNEKEGYVSLSVMDADPIVAAQVAKATEGALQKRIIDYKIENARSLYEFTSEQFGAKQREFYALQDELAEFTDRNRNISSAQFQNQKQRLEAQYSIVNAVYTELAKQKEQAAIQVSKDTPIFSVIDPVVVPKEKTSPKRGLILVIYTFLGAVLSIGYVLVEEPFKNLKKEITA